MTRSIRERMRFSRRHASNWLKGNPSRELDHSKGYCTPMTLDNQHAEAPAQTSEVCLQSATSSDEAGPTETRSITENSTREAQQGPSVALPQRPSDPRLYR
jgi:hypothetical protein